MCGALAIRLPCGVEQRAGEIEPLLDVDRIGGVLQPQAHLLGDRHEEVVEDLQHHRIDGGADRAALPAAATTRVSTRWSSGGDLGLPAGLDHRGGIGLGDDRRARRSRRRAACRRGGTAASRATRPSEVRLHASLQRTAVAGARRALRDAAARVASPPPIASTDTDSTTRRRSRHQEGKALAVRCVEVPCASRRASPKATVKAVSVPSYFRWARLHQLHLRRGTPCAFERSAAPAPPASRAGARTLAALRAEGRFDRHARASRSGRRDPCHRRTARRPADGEDRASCRARRRPGRRAGRLRRRTRSRCTWSRRGRAAPRCA